MKRHLPKQHPFTSHELETPNPHQSTYVQLPQQKTMVPSYHFLPIFSKHTNTSPPNEKPLQKTHMGVSENRGTPKSSIFIGFSIINHPFWGTTIFGNTHIGKKVNPKWQDPTFPCSARIWHQDQTAFGIQRGWGG